MFLHGILLPFVPLEGVREGSSTRRAPAPATPPLLVASVIRFQSSSVAENRIPDREQERGSLPARLILCLSSPLVSEAANDTVAVHVLYKSSSLGFWWGGVVPCAGHTSACGS